MRRLFALCCAVMAITLLAACREVRVKTYAQGVIFTPGSNLVAIVRDRRELEALGIRAPVKFNHEFGVVLIMGPHHNGGYRQIIESIRANDNRVRIVAFERAPAAGGDPTREYRTYTLWIVPNSVYRHGSIVDVVTPSGDPVASTVLR
jgi:hypothetical protein